jgi:hypothetical protein
LSIDVHECLSLDVTAAIELAQRIGVRVLYDCLRDKEKALALALKGMAPGEVLGVALGIEGLFFPKLAKEGTGNSGKKVAIFRGSCIGALVVVGYDKGCARPGYLPTHSGIGLPVNDGASERVQPFAVLGYGVGIEQNDDIFLSHAYEPIEYRARKVLLGRYAHEGASALFLVSLKDLERAIRGTRIHGVEDEVLKTLPAQGI